MYASSTAAAKLFTDGSNGRLIQRHGSLRKDGGFLDRDMRGIKCGKLPISQGQALCILRRELTLSQPTSEERIGHIVQLLRAAVIVLQAVKFR